jgi:hypothetical protein
MPCVSLLAPIDVAGLLFEFGGARKQFSSSLAVITLPGEDTILGRLSSKLRSFLLFAHAKDFKKIGGNVCPGPDKGNVLPIKVSSPPVHAGGLVCIQYIADLWNSDNRPGFLLFTKQREKIMVSKTAFLTVAFLAAAALPALAQGGGGGGGGAGGAGGGASSAGAGSGAGAGSAAGGGTVNSGSAIGGTANGGTTGNNNSQVNSQTPTTAAPAGSPTAVQASRNSGAGTASNGVPIGSPGSGVGSPEHPVGTNQ